MSRGMPKGKSGNPAGKPKGAQNKVTLEVKEKISKFVDLTAEEAFEDFKNMKTPEVRVKYFIELCKLVLPRPKDPDEEEEGLRRHEELMKKIFGR